MYDPAFNSILVEIDDQAAEWGTGNDDEMLGKSYSRGTVIKVGAIWSTKDHPVEDEDNFTDIQMLKGAQIMWNLGVEAGTTFDHDGKLYGFIYWWDLRGVKS